MPEASIHTILPAQSFVEGFQYCPPATSTLTTRSTPAILEYSSLASPEIIKVAVEVFTIETDGEETEEVDGTVSQMKDSHDFDI
ncbi:hypothetical protein ES707_19957 [subsurface metagenome]